jgi:hypothetical protein
VAVTATELALALGRGAQTPQVGVDLAIIFKVPESTAPPAP